MKKKRVLRWLEWIFWGAGFILLGSYLFVYANRTAYEAYNEWKFDRELKHEPAPAIGFLLHQLRFGATRPTPEPSQDEAEPIVPILPHRRPSVLAPGSLVGRIEIPRLDLRVMVLESTDSGTLRVAAGHIEGTALPGQPGNIGIAAHRDTFFRPLRNIRKDDEIDLTTLEGSYRYRVESTRIVKPTDTQVLDNTGADTLTLVTCYPFYYVGAAPNRFIVQAQLIPGRSSAGAKAPPAAGPATTPRPSRGS